MCVAHVIAALRRVLVEQEKGRKARAGGAKLIPTSVIRSQYGFKRQKETGKSKRFFY